MVYFKKIEKSEHFKEEHDGQIPWSKIVEVILFSKQKKKRGDKIEIPHKKYYILCELQDQTLYVINVKVRD